MKVSLDKENEKQFSFDWGPKTYSVHIRAMDLSKKPGLYPDKKWLESIWNDRKAASVSDSIEIKNL